MACSKCGGGRRHMDNCSEAGGGRGKPQIDPGTDARTKRDLKQENSPKARQVITGRALRAKQKANLRQAKKEEADERKKEEERKKQQGG
jgi:hypothetical protein